MSTPAPISRPADSLTIASPAAVRAEIVRQLSGLWLRLIIAVVLLILGSAAALITPWLMGKIVDLAASNTALLGRTGSAAVWWAGGAMLGATILSALLSAIGFILLAGVVDRVIARLRERVIASGLALPVARIEEVGVGDLVTRTTDDVSVLTQTANEALPTIALSGFAVGVTVVGMAAMDWRFALVMLALLPIYVLGIYRYRRVAPEKYLAERSERSARSAELLSTLRGIRTVRAFALQSRQHALVARHSLAVVRLAITTRILSNRLFGHVNLAEWVGMSLLLLVGFFLVGQDAATVGMVTTATLLFLRLFGPIGQLIVVVDPISSAAASLRRVVGVLAEHPEGSHPSSPADSSSAAASKHIGLRIEGLHVGYGGPDVLSGIDATIPHGSTVALVGPSGAGKTTLAGAIAGLRPSTSGRICFIDGDREINADELSAHERAQLVGVVTQEVHVFAGPLREDLSLAKPEATHAELLQALDAVGASQWVQALPEGLDTVVGAHGATLTPVQSQQLALARILLADPPLVILDEATAEAGSAGAATLEDAGRAVTEGRTSLVIAHRLAQAAQADLICHLVGGRIIEQGTHEELLAAGGDYATLWQAWSQGR